MTAKPYPAWFGPSDSAAADKLVRSFIDDAFDHRADCPVCQARRPCDELRSLIDGVGRGVREIGDAAFVEYCAVVERKYGSREWRAP